MHNASQPLSPTAETDAVGQVQTVLVVEDSKVEQERLRAMLQGFGYCVMTADGADEALQVLLARPIELILSDWQMPGISGLELCRTIRQAPNLGEPYFILVTGRDTGSDLVAGMDAGADDFITKPFNGEELRVRVQAGARLTELRRRDERRSRQLAELLRRETQEHRRICEDLALAARMQSAALPMAGRPFPHIEIGTLFHATIEVAGDGYGFFPLDDRHLGFFVIDVAGHGVAAAMVSFTVARLLSPDNGSIALLNNDNGAWVCKDSALPCGIVAPHRVIDALNRHFIRTVDGCHYFTMIYGVLDVDTGVGELCQAGHPHPLIVAGADKVERVGKGGFPVGLLEGASYESVRFRLGAGERLVLFSDGVIDCRSPSGQPFAERRLVNLLAKTHAVSLPTAVLRVGQALREWRGTEASNDDISLLGIGRLAAGDAPG